MVALDMAVPGATSTGTIYCIAGGTRGDQQPLIMTAKRLQAMGYRIIVCIGAEGTDWVKQWGFEMIEFASFEKVVNENQAVRAAADSGNFTDFFEALGKSVNDSLPQEITAVYDAITADKTAVGVVCTSIYWHIATIMQKKLGIYGTSMFMSPFFPTSDFAPYMIDTRDPATWQSLGPPFDTMTEPPVCAYVDLWSAMLNSMTQKFLPAYKQAVQLCNAEGLFEFASDEEAKEYWIEQRLNGEHSESNPLFVYSKVLVENGPSGITQKQFDAQLSFVFDENSNTLQTSMSPFDDRMQAFLKAGEAPIYFGWGSMSRESNDELLRAAVGSCRRLGKRGIILGGWAHLNLEMLDTEKDADLIAYCSAGNIYFAEKANHILLFPECACAVVHGGIGTTACILRSGRPGIVTPCWWDQNFCGDRLEALGVGRRGPHFSKLDEDNLSALLGEVLSEPSYAVTCPRVREALLAEEPGDVQAAARIDAGIRARLATPLERPPSLKHRASVPPRGSQQSRTLLASNRASMPSKRGLVVAQ
ncbi:unnamed protein product [Prorocentrum cordatum]|uniref:Erythromycin biosynthesis protein CIII-like C-terminal domain-containing protein n=1 Tax=Prorocentrum cordatum TaxID=2364126 RepID=A0ABN9X9Y6_9DINO|nr:unnamed protein product [Polarella glacialis]